MINQSREQGFTTAELLITIFVGVAFILTGYQLYGIIAGNSSNTQQQAIASNLAYADLQVATGSSTVAPACTASPQVSSTTPVPTGTLLPSGSTVTTTFSCPYGTSSTITEVIVTVNYGSGQATHGIYATR